MITFDESTHTYQKNGKRVYSVTQICALIVERFPVHPWYLHRGALLHKIAEWHDTGELEIESVDDKLMEYYHAYCDFVEQVRPTIKLIEKQLYHPKYNYCGKPDRYGEMLTYPAVWDLKFGQPSEADCYQAPAYMFLLKANGYRVEKCFDIYLKTNGKYKVEEVKSPTTRFLDFISYIPREGKNGNSSN